MSQIIKLLDVMVPSAADPKLRSFECHNHKIYLTSGYHSALESQSTSTKRQSQPLAMPACFQGLNTASRRSYVDSRS
jgi:hypothetical protein